MELDTVKKKNSNTNFNNDLNTRGITDTLNRYEQAFRQELQQNKSPKYDKASKLEKKSANVATILSLELDHNERVLGSTGTETTLLVEDDS